MGTGVIILKIINSNELPVRTSIEKQRNQSQKRTEEQTKKLGQKIDEQTENQLALRALLRGPVYVTTKRRAFS